MVVDLIDDASMQLNIRAGMAPRIRVAPAVGPSAQMDELRVWNRRFRDGAAITSFSDANANDLYFQYKGFSITYVPALAAASGFQAGKSADRESGSGFRKGLVLQEFR